MRSTRSAERLVRGEVPERHIAARGLVSFPRRDHRERTATAYVVRTTVRKGFMPVRAIGRTVQSVGRRVDVDQLVGAEDIAERLGLGHYRRVHELRTRKGDFPEPVLRVRRTMVWYWPDIERWAKTTGRLPKA